MVQRVDRVAMTVTSVLLCGNFLMFLFCGEILLCAVWLQLWLLIVVALRHIYLGNVYGFMLSAYIHNNPHQIKKSKKLN